jgi:hypothetical protein
MRLSEWLMMWMMSAGVKSCRIGTMTAPYVIVAM